MKKILISLLSVLLLTAASVWAQTPQEIIARMDQEKSRFDKEGFSMVMEMKLPLLGTFSTKVFSLGDKYKMLATVKDKQAVNWSDGVTDWEYDASKNEITVKNAKPHEKTQAEDNAGVLDSVTEGYDVKLTKETDKAWYFYCKKSKTNKNKDDPKAIDLVVSKATYLPISTSVKEKGITITLRDFSVGVSDEEVTFNPADYPDAKIIDQR
ncbi:MAG: hypothetical protein IJL61_00285 [Bacteroidales bacterium]|nr:hypothetical protein [Bacteroidales bacterium]